MMEKVQLTTTRDTHNTVNVALQQKGQTLNR